MSVSDYKKFDYNKKEFSEIEKDILYEEVVRIRQKYPEHIPVLCSSAKLGLSRHKYLVGPNITFQQFIFSVRSRVKCISQEDGIFFLVNNVMPTGSASMSTIYNEHKNPETLFLHVVVQKESVFGQKLNKGLKTICTQNCNRHGKSYD